MHPLPTIHRPTSWSGAALCTARYTCPVSNRWLSSIVRSTAGAPALVLFTALCSVPAWGASPAPSLPPAGSGTAAPSPAAPAPDLSPLERAQRGVVILERAGHAVGLGMVLAGDGRMLTSLSAIGDGNGLDARYADDSVVAVRVGHSDRVWDLALLVPQVGRWEAGVSASPADPLSAGSTIRTFTQRRRKVVVASILIQGRAELLGGDGEILRDALQLSTRVASSDLGAPLVDDQGRVVAIIGRACAASGGDGGTACKAVAYGAPVDALRQFLRSAPANAIPPSPWLGIQAVAATTAVARGVRVAGVQPESPAAQGGLRAGPDPAQADVIISVNGTPVMTPEKLASLVRERAVGDKLELIVVRENKLRVLNVTLRAAPVARPKAPGARR